MSEIELQDAIIKHALDLQRLSAHDEAQAVEILRQLEAELRALLAGTTLSEAGKAQINAILADADKAIAEHYVGAAAAVDVHGLVLVVADNTARAIAGVLPAVASPTAERLASLAKSVLIEGSPAADWGAKQSEDTAFRFAGVVRQGVVNGQTNEQIVARVAGREGFMEVSKRNARTLVHSSVMTAANTARLAVYRKNMHSMDGVRWLATLDTHTCIICMALDGVAWDFDRNPIKSNTLDWNGGPPAHMGCRCVLSPLPNRSAMDEIFPGMGAEIDALGGRASALGPTGSDTSMAGFISRLSPAQQDDMLGKGRADLFRAGDITLRDLVSGQGRPLSLEELKARQ
jgi:SPP1 gp7 family putative phage head morphogenesis protein